MTAPKEAPPSSVSFEQSMERLTQIVDKLEEESLTDQDYYIDQPTIDLLGDGSATDHLLTLLRSALGSAEGVEIRWQKR